MKTLIGSLLFTTAILINFPELNSYRPPPSNTAPTTIPAKVPFEVYGRHINVDITISILNNHVTLDRLTVLGPALLGIPSNHNPVSYNYITHAVFNDHEGHTVKIVVYVKEDDNEVRTLVGAKLPHISGVRLPTDDPRLLDPDTLTWFITYEGTIFTVKLDPVTKRVCDIKPTWFRNKRPDQQHLLDHGLEYPHAHCGGVYFLVFKEVKRVTKVVGAALDPYWQFRPGEDFAHLNPHIKQETPITLQTHLHSDPNAYNAEQHAHQASTSDVNQNLQHQHNAGPSQHYQHVNPYENVFPQTPAQINHPIVHDPVPDDDDPWQYINFDYSPSHSPQRFDPNQNYHHQYHNPGP